MLESGANQIHMPDSCADLKHMLESGAGRLNTTYVTRQVKGVPQGANCCVGRSNLRKHLLHGISNAYQEPQKVNTKRRQQGKLHKDAQVKLHKDAQVKPHKDV